MSSNDWMRFPYIETGYRTGVTNYKTALFSLFSLHNENNNMF